MTDETILIITHKEDYTADYVVNILNQRGICYYRLNCEDVFKKDFTIESDLFPKIDGKRKFKSVWFRRTKLPELPNTSLYEKNYLYNEFDTLLKNLFVLIDAKWISEPYNIYKAENKLYQLKLAKKIGFQTPNTLVTNSKLDIVNFFYQNSNKLIVKPLSQSIINNENNSLEHIFTNLVNEEHIENLNNFDLTPCIFQQYIEKEVELRITVIGENIFIAGVYSQTDEMSKVDWRKGHLKFHTTTIPKNVEKMCLELVKELNIKFGAIDMIKDKNGNYIFIEINPNGQWVWIENETGLDISNALIDELLC
ncbi:hypothetical protein [Chryseobacterium lathyri]|uniref:hypothetical protein n=1 Tax=Chryseobacterium lathyri TaxID=395933 RepID=UPI001CBAFF6B|nr:hypothetical protein [Chryseobacterium lathyri]